MSYRIPRSAVFHLLYEVGGTGNVDIHTNMKASIAEKMREIFGVEVVDLQMSDRLFAGFRRFGRGGGKGRPVPQPHK